MSDTLSNIGHNTEAGRKLNAYIERIETMMAEKAEIASDISEEFKAAKGEGFDPKIMRSAIRLRKMDQDRRQEEESLLEVYLHALGEV